LTIYGFFLEKEQRADFIDKELHERKQIEAEKKTETALDKPRLKPGVTLIKLQHSYKGVPGYWLQVRFEENELGKEKHREVERLFREKDIPQEVFYPRKPTESRELIKGWYHKYALNSLEDSRDKWKIFYQEIRNHFDRDRVREAYVGMNMILKYHPEFLKKYRRYALYEDIAIYYEEQGEIKKAEKAIKKPLYLNIKSEEPYLNLSAFYMLHGMEEKAYKIGKFALKRYPKNVFVICNQAVILATLDAFDRALEIIGEAEKKGITDPLLYKTKGELLSDLERDLEAIRTFKKGLKRTKIEDKILRIELLSNLGESYIHTKEYEKAVKTYEKIYKEDPKDLYHLLRLVGTNFYDLKNYDQALKYGELLIKEEPGMSSYHYLLGLIRMEKGDLELAQWHLYKAKQLMPTHPLIEEELRELRSRRRAKGKLKDKLPKADK